MICLSCVNNLELFDSFRNVCFLSDTTSRVELDKYLKVKPEEVLLEDLIWEDELGADCSPKISSSPDDDETPGRNISSSDNVAAIIEHILAEELPCRKALDEMCCTRSELDHKIDSQDKLFTHKISSVSQKISDTHRKMYVCDICSQSFYRKYNLSEHMSVHSGEKPHKCDVCLESFLEQYQLNAHRFIHIGVKLHKCEICSKLFSTKRILSDHMGIHYKCDICSKTFTTKQSIGEHMGNHTMIKVHKCDICFKSYTSKGNLSTHMSVHTGVKPHKCDICSKSFLKKYELNAHMGFHTGVRPYKCDICKKS
ncbi:uncharacterized protein LOC143919137 [Arctopsyche grandis]|uniref:uncharacterized protein LOC143919137 n=1 Tax=Arctopsyche grandis TaxID=121162 RepID=UPI00406D6644